MDRRSHSDRRLSPRHVTNWHVRFGRPGDLAQGFLADISLAGLSILNETSFECGSEIEVQFVWAGHQEPDGLRLRAVVCHCTGHKLGARFLDLDDSARERIWKVMRGVP